jgi:uncharacterized protein YrzB (UPF0473 family)
MSEERDDVVVLVDENGEEAEFEYLDTIEMDGNEYVVLIPLDEIGEENENEDEDEEVVIFRLEQSKDGEDTFITIEDEDEIDAVFKEFMLRMEDEYDFEDDE